jgi:hypothetical protein
MTSAVTRSDALATQSVATIRIWVVADQGDVARNLLARFRTFHWSVHRFTFLGNQSARLWIQKIGAPPHWTLEASTLQPFWSLSGTASYQLPCQPSRTKPCPAPPQPLTNCQPSSVLVSSVTSSRFKSLQDSSVFLSYFHTSIDSAAPRAGRAGRAGSAMSSNGQSRQRRQSRQSRQSRQR